MLTMCLIPFAHCLHRQSLNKIFNYMVSNTNSEKWEPIRITMNYSQLYDDYDDEFKCTKDKVGKNITWKENYPFVAMCTNELVLDQKTINYIVEVFENVRKYLESMLKVKRLKSPHQKLFPSRNGNVPNITYSNTDLYITVFPRIYPENRKSVASSMHTAIDYKTKRPTQGVIALNVEYTKGKYSKTLNDTILHEIIHILGVSNGHYHLWHSHENNKAYGKKYISQIEIGGVNRKIINAPYSHNFAVNHYGVETFKSGSQEVRSGIILEDYGEPFNVPSHVDILYYFNELMISETCDISRLTEVTMSLLMDTGYYKVDYTKGKPLWWGSKETNNGEFIKDFITGPPQKIFPYNYLVDPKRSDYLLSSGFDYSFIGTTYDLHKDPPEFVKQNIDWYNPLNSTYYGNEFLGYQRIVFPMFYCKNGTAAVNFKDDDADCLRYEIDGPNIIFFDNDTVINCTKRDEEVTGYNGSVIICPEPSDFAVRVNLRHRNTFDHNPLEIKSTSRNDRPIKKISKAKFTKVYRKGYRHRWFLQLIYKVFRLIANR